MSNKDSYQDFQHKINLYLDKALPEKDHEDLLKKVQHDPTCHKMLDSEKSFRHFIKNNVRCNPVSQEIIQSIRDRIKSV